MQRPKRSDLKWLHQFPTRRATCALALALVWLACGCASNGAFCPPPDRAVTRVRVAQSGQMIGLRENRILAVHLGETFGVTQWSLEKAPKPRVLRYLGTDSAVGRKVPCLKDGDVVFYFEAEGPGITSLRIVPAGEKGGPGERAFDLTVEVTY
jgi:hypothetical protein